MQTQPKLQLHDVMWTPQTASRLGRPLQGHLCAKLQLLLIADLASVSAGRQFEFIAQASAGHEKAKVNHLPSCRAATKAQTFTLVPSGH